MDKRKALLLVVALLIAGITAMAIKARISVTPEGEQAAPPAPTQRILVAKKDIPAGSFVKAGDDIDWAAWPTETIQPYHVKEGVEQVTSYQGAVSRRAIKMGEAVTPSVLVKPGAGGFLSAVLEPGKRAVSLGVTATSGNAGFIFPGDRVDLIVTHRMKLKESPNDQEKETVISETFVQNVRVVAVDQMMDNPENKAILAKTVTVEVTPKEAQRIAVAEDLGKIAITLRSLSDETDTAKPQEDPNTPDPFIEAMKNSAPATDNYTRDSDISAALDRNASVSPRVLVIRGEQSERREFY